MSTVATPRKDYQALRPSWDMVAAIRGGTDAMRNAGQTYLPIHPAESVEAWTARLHVSVFTNFYAKIVKRMVSKLMELPPAPTEETPDEMRTILDNVDACGNSLEVFSRDLLNAAIDDGVVHLLIDHPEANAEDVQTLADQSDLRPFASIIRARQVVNWDQDKTDGQERLVRIHIHEFVELPDPDDEWMTMRVEQVRVIRPGSVEVWRRDSENEWSVHQTIETEFEDIPLVTLHTRKITPVLGEPLLSDVAHLNVRHWQSDSDQQHITHVARVPILHAKGFEDLHNPGGEIALKIGPNQVATSGPEGELQYVEITGKGPELGQTELDAIEDRIRKLGSEVILGQRTGSQTATARALDQAEADVDLSAIAGNTEDALNKVIEWLGWWMNLDQPGGVTVFQDFKTFATPDDLDQLLKSRNSGNLTLRTYLTEVQRRGLLDPDLNIADEVDLIGISDPFAGDDLDLIDDD